MSAPQFPDCNTPDSEALAVMLSKRAITHYDYPTNAGCIARLRGYGWPIECELLPGNNNTFDDSLPVNTHMYFISRDNLRELWKELGGLIYCFIEDELGYPKLIPPMRHGDEYSPPEDVNLDLDSYFAHVHAWLQTPVVDSFGGAP
jgi:hypothetical protein